MNPALKRPRRIILRIAAAIIVGAGSASLVQAQTQDGPKTTSRPPEEGRSPAPPAEPLPEDWSYHFQATAVIQGRGAMDSPYSGPNSFSANRENATTVTSTLYLGRRLWPGGAIYLDPEISGGSGLSKTLGLAGAPNGEAVRASTATPKAYIGRLYLEQSVDIGTGYEPVPPDQNQLAGRQCTERLTFTLGKLSATDIFDDNAYSHDPKTQFLNWSLMTNGAWDYPADARGYTYGAAAQLVLKDWAVRYGIFAMPEEANGFTFDRALSQAHGQSLEVEYDYVMKMPGKVRLMGYLNNAHMGDYRQAIQNAPVNPDVTSTRDYRIKFGVTLNAEQKLTEELGAFLRLGWNDGRTETFALTEIDRTFQSGLTLQGVRWERPEDTVAVAVVVNGISSAHRDYLDAGGLGFLLGDGRLHYGPETILEAYYQARLFKSLFLSLDYQFVDSPGYNRDRGPVSIYGLRVHVEF